MEFEIKKSPAQPVGCAEDNDELFEENQGKSDVVADAGNGHFGVAKGLCLGLLAAGGIHHHLQQFAAQIVQSLGAVDQGGGVQIDVILHLGKGQLIAGDLDDGDNGIAGGRTAATGKDHYLHAAGHHGCHGGGIVARRVHSP